MEVMKITQENFEQDVMKAKEPVLLDFWADWCGPCRMVSPIVDAIAQDADGFRVGKVNVDEQSGLAETFHVASIPTLIVMKNGEIAGKLVGFHNKNEILGLLAK